MIFKLISVVTSRDYAIHVIILTGVMGMVDFTGCSPACPLGGYNNQLAGNICTWRLPGDSFFATRDLCVGRTLTVARSGSIIPDYPPGSSSGFDYAIPNRGKKRNRSAGDPSCIQIPL